jgi:hypothetical protein
MNRRRLTFPAVVVAITLSACGAHGNPDGMPTGFTPASTPRPSSVSKAAGPSYTPVSTSAALAYVQAHPVAPRTGMVAGVFLNEGATDVPPGNNPTGTVLTVTVVTASGNKVTATCGNVAANEGCAVPDAGRISGAVGSYIWIPADGQITSADDIQLITGNAVPGGWS